ncbi:amino acid transporter [Athelia psychrophila]|uniref:Amino acid transporter n=1 Tax=Athelia psychrophila TaxID=1759441 RepID=A0A166XE66_9AGAM|nr:amino acid transporter [Fibularhizoctonia sp. CBS 109695]
MFGRSARAKDTEGESAQPLLSHSSENLVQEDQVIFALDENEDDYAYGRASHEDEERPEHNVRFQEHVQVIGPPLRSTMQSREAEFELDSDELDEDAVIHVDDDVVPTSRSGRRDQRMPLLVGLLESSARRSLDNALPLQSTNEICDAELEEIAAKRSSGGGILDSTANMANSILGAGIIGLPYAVSQAGFVAGLLLLVTLGLVTDWTIRLIVTNAKLSGRTSYIDIMDHCFGPSGRAAVSFFQFSFAFGGMCAFGIIIGDTIPHVIRSIFPTISSKPVLSLFANRQFIIALCTITVSYPLSLNRDIHKLARASGLALIGMIIIVTSVLVEGPQVPASFKGDPSKRFSVFGPGLFPAIGVISFAFVCHHNSLLIYGSLNTPTLNRFAKVTHISVALSLVSCMTLAVSAYIVFTDKTQGNVLNNFPQDDVVINVARFCFGVNMFTTLPLELFVCREVIEQYFYSHEAYNHQRHLFLTTAILFTSTMISLFTCDLGVMLEITGGVSATALAYIFPAACYYKLIDPKPPWYSRAKLPSVICVAFGVVVLCISLWLALAKTWTTEGDARMCI